MEKSRLAKIAGVGLLGIFCLPVIAQAQGGLVKAGYNTVKAACKEAGCPLIKMIEESSGKINKAVVESAKASKVGVEMINPGVTGIAKKATVNTPKRLIEQPGFLHQVEQHVQEGMSGFRQPQAPKVKAPATHYYSMANNAEKIPTLVQQVEPQAAQNIVRPVGDVETKNFRYTPGNSIGFHYQQELQYDIWGQFRWEVEWQKRGYYNWETFPTTLEEQSQYIKKFLENQKDEVKELFANSHLDITTQAQIAYTAHEWRKLTVRDLANYPKLGIMDVLSSSNKEVNIRMLFYLADTATRDWMHTLQRTYGVDKTLQETVDWAATNHHLTLMQVEELLKSIDLRSEVIAQMNEMELPHLINQKAKEIAQAAQAQWEIASRAVPAFEVPLQQMSQLEEAIMMGHLNAEQSAEMVEKALDAVRKWDSSGSSINHLWLLLRENQAKGITLSAQEVLEEADRIFRY